MGEGGERFSGKVRNLFNAYFTKHSCSYDFLQVDVPSPDVEVLLLGRVRTSPTCGMLCLGPMLESMGSPLIPLFLSLDEEAGVAFTLGDAVLVHQPRLVRFECSAAGAASEIVKAFGHV